MPVSVKSHACYGLSGWWVVTLGADTSLRAPFPWPGGKRRVGTQVWNYLSPVGRYVEPFAGARSPRGWREIAYTARGTSSANRSRERFWISESCLSDQLFDLEAS